MDRLKVITGILLGFQLFAFMVLFIFMIAGPAYWGTYLILFGLPLSICAGTVIMILSITKSSSEVLRNVIKGYFMVSVVMCVLTIAALF